MVEPAMLQGRWLQTADERAIVVSSALMRDDPDLQLGSELIIKIEGDEERWTIVGVIQSLGPFAYAPYDIYAEISGETGRAIIAMVQLRAGSAAERAAQIPQLEQGFEAGGMRVSSIISLDQERAEVEAAFNVLTGLLIGDGRTTRRRRRTGSDQHNEPERAGAHPRDRRDAGYRRQQRGNIPGRRRRRHLHRPDQLAAGGPAGAGGKPATERRLRHRLHQRAAERSSGAAGHTDLAGSNPGAGRRREHPAGLARDPADDPSGAGV